MRLKTNTTNPQHNAKTPHTKKNGQTKKLEKTPSHTLSHPPCPPAQRGRAMLAAATRQGRQRPHRQARQTRAGGGAAYWIEDTRFGRFFLFLVACRLLYLLLLVFSIFFVFWMVCFDLFFVFFVFFIFGFVAFFLSC